MGKKNRNGIRQVNDSDIAQAFTGVGNDVEQDVAERSGSDDKVEAVREENAPPRVATYTPEGRAWMDQDPYGLKTEGLYGQRGRLAIHPNQMQKRAQFLGRPLDVADLLEIHGPDTSAPESYVDTVTGEVLTSFVRTAMINDEGDLVRDQEQNIVYRGQFVVTGKPLAVHVTATGDTLYKLRNARGKRKTIKTARGERQVADLLPSQCFDQANARLAGINGHFAEKSAEKQAFNERLGFTMNDARRRNPTADENGFDRGSYAPRTPRGKVRKQDRTWA